MIFFLKKTTTNALEIKGEVIFHISNLIHNALNSERQLTIVKSIFINLGCEQTVGA